MDENRHAVNFGLALVAALEERQLTQSWLAERAGISNQLVSNWVKGQREPPPRRAVEIEELLDVSPGSLTIHLGFLPPAGGTISITSPEDAIISDAELGGDDKRFLLSLLKRFRA